MKYYYMEHYMGHYMWITCGVADKNLFLAFGEHEFP